jgi:hypothetical protein
MKTDLLADLIVWWSSEQGPLFALYEDAELGHFEDQDLSWPEALEIAGDPEQMALGQCEGETIWPEVLLYRRLLAEMEGKGE